MEIKYSKHYLRKLEDVFSESDYILRYEKGNFKPGYCIIRDSKNKLPFGNTKRNKLRHGETQPIKFKIV